MSNRNYNTSKSITSKDSGSRSNDATETSALNINTTTTTLKDKKRSLNMSATTTTTSGQDDNNNNNNESQQPQLYKGINKNYKLKSIPTTTSSTTSTTTEMNLSKPLKKVKKNTILIESPTKTNTSTASSSSKLNKNYNPNSNNLTKLFEQQTSSFSSLSSSKTTTTTTIEPEPISKIVLYLPHIIQKYIIEFLVQQCYISFRQVSKYWHRVSDSLIENLVIYFTGITSTSSVVATLESFSHTITTNLTSLRSLSFVNASKYLEFPRYYYNTLVHPFIVRVIKHNTIFANLTIKGFPLLCQEVGGNIYGGSNTPYYDSFSSPSQPSNAEKIEKYKQRSKVFFDCLFSPSSVVTSIKFKNVSFDTHSLYLFFNSLQPHRNLESLSIVDNIGVEGPQLLSQIIQKGGLLNLRNLTISNNTQSEELTLNIRDLILHMVKSNNQQPIQSITTNGTTVPSSSPPVNIINILSIFKLEYLDLSSNALDDNALMRMIGAIAKLETLQTLVLSNNRLSLDENITWSPINFGPYIVTLNLSKNRISGTTRMTEYLATTHHLKNLDLSSNILGHGGSKRLCRSILANISITELDVSCNRIESIGAASIIDAVCANNIQRLILHSNNIDNTCCKFIGHLFTQKPVPITFLNLSNNKIGLVAFKDIIKYISKYNKIHLKLDSQIYFNNYQEIEKLKEEEVEEEVEKENKTSQIAMMEQQEEEIMLEEYVQDLEYSLINQTTSIELTESIEHEPTILEQQVEEPKKKKKKEKKKKKKEKEEENNNYNEEDDTQNNINNEDNNESLESPETITTTTTTTTSTTIEKKKRKKLDKSDESIKTKKKKSTTVPKKKKKLLIEQFHQKEQLTPICHIDLSHNKIQLNGAEKHVQPYQGPTINETYKLIDINV
ncbi:hypothetical protein DFA_04025 [Cavenderia fasciculata]|uniref:Leucine-rich repeat-containing protein n=1 Tax=Cavenderia fasciculata TaxID=261658 RepID=F4Q130_CACFS|nr:uncharacterized protein DFA_04025 [Cavenderia fasciculata]EGG18531.1 hypothetical protein DFA_04025 [Cavenderia fasciculata]|eukprot:XP_004366435.1 hypothetical protein DFA_04025 [Cavenderia fasciculata]